VTLFGIFLTPVFFFVIDRVGASRLFAAPLLRQVSALPLTLPRRLLTRLTRPRPAKVAVGVNGVVSRNGTCNGNGHAPGAITTAPAPPSRSR
jgi:hypothetical protein